MKKTHSYALFTLLLTLVLISGIACHLIFPYQSVNFAAQQEYLCYSQIYRPLDNNTGLEFTEEWEFYAFPPLQCSISKDPCVIDQDCGDGETCQQQSAIEYCTEKIEDYIDDYMAPGFEWDYRNLVASNILKKGAADCDDTPAPKTYGAPFGAEIRWNYPHLSPPNTTAYAYVYITDKDGKTASAEPGIANAYADFAERTGLPDEGGAYIRGKRHIRFSDLFLELDTPFDLGDLKITKFYIQNIGTVIGEGDTGIDYKIFSNNAKFFLYAQGEKSGNTGVTSLCFLNGIPANVRVYQGPPNAFFTLALDVTLDIGDAGNLFFKISLSKPTASPSFKTHQPFVQVYDKHVDSPVELTPDTAFHHYDKIKYYYWFENFESSSNEKFLGKGKTLSNIDFTKGIHEVTVVAYDDYGSYNSDTMTLTVNNTPPSAIDDEYSVKEDNVLDIVATGVLENDTDDDGDSITAIKVSDPTNGILQLNADGSFTYTPNDNFYGDDSFQYKANDGTDDSAAATVKIKVIEVTNVEEINNLEDGINDLLNDGTLSEGTANSLIVKLKNALKSLNNGNKNAACNQLKALLNQIQSLISDGWLTTAQAQEIIDGVNNLRAELNCK